MRRFLILVLVFVSLFAFASCGGKKKEKPRFEEEITKEIKAEEGGTIESSDGKTSIEVPAGALDSDTVITMRIYNSSEYSFGEGEQVVTKVVEFQPSGLIFKKPLIITMPVENAFEKRILTAAVLKEAENRWSYNEHGVYAVLAGREAGGDPIMLSAGGDPIMLNAGGDPIMMDAGGDPIMLAAAGDPIMLNAGGDPIMISSLGDPIMSAAMGDPIMMTTGHFTAFTFIALESADYEPGDSDSEPARPDDDEASEPDYDVPARPDGNEPVNDGDTDTTEPDVDEPNDDGDTDISDDDITVIDDTDDTDDTDTAEPDDDEIPDETEDEDIIVSEPELVYSKVLCTGKSICNDYKNQILCPAEGEDFYGQDAQYAARKGCVPHSYTVPDTEYDDEHGSINQVHDNVTGLTWIVAPNERRLSEVKQADDLCSVEYSSLEGGPRLPTTKELMTLTDHSVLYDYLIDQNYFGWLYRNIWTAEKLIYDTEEGTVYGPYDDTDMALMWCVRGEEYGKVDEEMYEILGEGNEKVVFDSSTNLIWQKEYAENKTWKDALSYCENLEYAGKSDWRLPNKNELMTLIDYSKEEGPFSSFPDMPTDGFWSSTAYDYYDSYDKVLSDGYAWMVYFEDAFVRSVPLYIAEEEVEYFPFQTEPGNAALSVRCVRSALDEKEEIPECDGSGIGSCRDASSGIVWSSRLYPEIFSSEVDMMREGLGYCGIGYGYGGLFFSAVMCRDLNENGSNKWRIPTIEEISTIFSTGRVRTALNDSGVLVSGSISGEGSECPMFTTINVADGSGEVSWDPTLSELVIRCVYDEELDFKTAPYTDPETELTWSEASPTVLSWEEAVDFCNELNFDDSEHYWRVPTYDELITLNKSSEEHSCKKYGDSGYFCFSGEYSLFGDIGEFWAEGGNCGSGDKVWMKFWSFESYCIPTSEQAFKVRCVSDGPNPCKNDPCAGVSHATRCFPDSSEIYHCGCDENYTWNGVDGVCAANTKSEECTGDLPEHAEWWSENITQTWSGNAWLPEITGEAIFSESEVENECRFKCIDGYFWSGTSCLVVTPYTDPETLLTWSAEAENAMDWDTAVAYCENLDEGGFSDWRLPTIDELRTVIQNCEKTQPGGVCALSDPDHLLYEEDYVSEDCSCGYVENNNGGYYSKLGYSDELGNIWSSSVEPGDPSEILGLLFYDGSAGYYLRSDVIYARCVRDDWPVLPVD